MPLPFQLPTSARYLKAKFRLLLRPIVWGPLAGMVLLALFTEPYWAPLVGWQLNRGEPDVAPEGTAAQLSVEDSAIGADIDSLSLLVQEINQPPAGEVIPGLNLLNLSQKPKQPVGFLESYTQENPAGAEAQPAKPVPVAPSQVGTTIAGIPNAATTAFDRAGSRQTSAGVTSGNPFLSQGIPSVFRRSTRGRTGDATATTSALQDAMAPSSTQLSSGTQPPVNPATAQSTLTPAQSPWSVPGEASVITPNSLGSPGRAATPSLYNPAFSVDFDAVDQMGAATSPSIAPPIAPLELPNSQTNATTPLNQPSIQTLPDTGGSSGAFPTQTVPAQGAAVNPPPFSVPRSVGNGQINTFSNP